MHKNSKRKKAIGETASRPQLKSLEAKQSTSTSSAAWSGNKTFLLRMTEIKQKEIKRERQKDLEEPQYPPLPPVRRNFTNGKFAKKKSKSGIKAAEEKLPPEDTTCNKKNVEKTVSTIVENGDFSSEISDNEEEQLPILETKTSSIDSVQLDLEVLTLEKKLSSSNSLDNILLECESSPSNVTLPMPSGLPFTHFYNDVPLDFIETNLDIPLNTTDKNISPSVTTSECQADLLTFSFTSDNFQNGTLTLRPLYEEHHQHEVRELNVFIDKSRFAPTVYRLVLLMNLMQNCARVPVMQGWVSSYVPNWETFFSRPILFGLLLSSLSS